MVLTESFLLTRDPRLKRYSNMAVDFIAQATVTWDTGPRPQSRCSSVWLLRLCFPNRTGLVCWRTKP